jgi:hypothetical protein
MRRFAALKLKSKAKSKDTAPPLRETTAPHWGARSLHRGELYFNYNVKCNNTDAFILLYGGVARSAGVVAFDLGAA